MYIKSHDELKSYFDKTNPNLWFSTDENGALQVEGYADIYLDGVKRMPDNVSFFHEGSVYFSDLEVMPSGYHFSGMVDDVVFDMLKKLTSQVSFKNRGDVIFEELSVLKGSQIFDNGGDVDFNKELKHIGRSKIEFRNRCSVNIMRLKTVVSSLVFCNELCVFIGHADKVVDNFQFNNVHNVFINVAALGTNVRFYNENITEIMGVTLIPNRCQFHSDVVILPDVTEIKSKNAFRGLDCCNVKIPKYTINSNRISFAGVNGRVKVNEVRRLPKTCEIVEIFNSNAFIIEGSIFASGVRLESNIVSADVESRLEHSGAIRSRWYKW